MVSMSTVLEGDECCQYGLTKDRTCIEHTACIDSRPYHQRDRFLWSLMICSISNASSGSLHHVLLIKSYHQTTHHSLDSHPPHHPHTLNATFMSTCILVCHSLWWVCHNHWWVCHLITDGRVLWLLVGVSWLSIYVTWSEMGVLVDHWWAQQLINGGCVLIPEGVDLIADGCVPVIRKPLTYQYRAVKLGLSFAMFWVDMSASS